MEIKRTNWTKYNCMETEHKESYTHHIYRWADRIKPEDIGRKECKRNGKIKGRMKIICCCSNGPERSVKSQRRRRKSRFWIWY